MLHQSFRSVRCDVGPRFRSLLDGNLYSPFEHGIVSEFPMPIIDLVLSDVCASPAFSAAEVLGRLCRRSGIEMWGRLFVCILERPSRTVLQNLAPVYEQDVPINVARTSVTLLHSPDKQSISIKRYGLEH